MKKNYLVEYLVSEDDWTISKYYTFEEKTLNEVIYEFKNFQINFISFEIYEIGNSVFRSNQNGF